MKAIISSKILAFLGLLSQVTQAVPTTNIPRAPARSLATMDHELNATILSLSVVTDNIFGQDSRRSDYYLTNAPRDVLEAMHTFHAVWHAGDEHEKVVAYLNATRFGQVTSDQAADTFWTCSELSDAMRANVKECDDVEVPEEVYIDMEGNVVPASGGLEKRAMWNWVRGRKYLTTQIGINLLSDALSSAGSATFRAGVTHFCNFIRAGDDNHACVTWSHLERLFTPRYARDMCQDAIHAGIDFNYYSVKAQGVWLHHKKRATKVRPASVCLHGVADHCT